MSPEVVPGGARRGCRRRCAAAKRSRNGHPQAMGAPQSSSTSSPELQDNQTTRQCSWNVKLHHGVHLQLALPQLAILQQATGTVHALLHDARLDASP